MTKIRVLLVDDHKVMLAGLRLVVNSQPDMEVVAEAESAQAALALAESDSVDVVVLDLTLPGGGSLPFVESLSLRKVAPRVLVLTMHDDPAYARAALGAGATGYVVKTIREEDLLAAVRAVQRGHAIVNLDDEERTARVFGSLSHQRTGGPFPQLFRLSAREEEVLHLLGRGYTNQAVAKRLELSPKTVATYRSRIAEKLGLKTTVDFVKYATDTGLLRGENEPR